MNRIKKIIGPYLEKDKNVLMAFLFGSEAKGLASGESDIDIAVYLKREGRKEEAVLWNKLEELLHRDVDLVILNRAPATISWSAIKRRIPLAIKDKGLFLDFMLDVSREAEDFIDFNLDTWRRKNALAQRG